MSSKVVSARAPLAGSMTLVPFSTLGYGSGLRGPEAKVVMRPPGDSLFCSPCLASLPSTEAQRSNVWPLARSVPTLPSRL